jgi:hypothetical protein
MPPSRHMLAGRYRLDALIEAADEYGEAWLGTDVILARPVTVRIVTDEAAFRVKAHLTGAVTHAGIVRIYDFDAGPPPFLVTEFVDGTPLAQVLRNEPMAAARVLDIVAQLASALASAHSAGVTHGALDAWKVLIGRTGPVKLTDFGGTGSEASDLYALGLLARQCLDHAGHVPASVSGVADWLTGTDPSRRPRDAAAVAARARLLLTELTPRVPGGGPAPARPRRKRLALAARRFRWRVRVQRGHVVAPLAAVVAIVGAFMLGRGLDPHAPQPRSTRTVATVLVNAAAMRGARVAVVSAELRRLGLSVDVQWRATTQLSSGLVLSVWPTGRVPAGSGVIVTGAARPPVPTPVDHDTTIEPTQGSPSSPVSRPSHAPARPRGHPRVPGAASPSASSPPEPPSSPSASPSPPASPTASPSPTQNVSINLLNGAVK